MHGAETHGAQLELISARGEAAIAVLRLAGPGIAAALAQLGVSRLPRPGRFALCRLQLGADLCEDALLLALADCWELHVHGNPLLVDRVLESLARALGPRDASAAEDAIQDEDGVERGPQYWREQILHGARAAPSRLGLELCLAQLAAGGLLELLTQPCTRSEIDAALARGRQFLPWLEPRRVVLRGLTNSGKSTLFNLLMGRQRVRVGDAAGLTRDSVEELVLLEDGLPILLVDSAGEREVPAQNPDANLEERAIAAARKQARSADLVLHLHALSAGGTPPAPRPGLLRIFTHSDLAPPTAVEQHPACAAGDLSCSLLDPDASALRRRISSAIGRALGIPPATELCAQGLAPAYLDDVSREALEARRASSDWSSR